MCRTRIDKTVCLGENSLRKITWKTEVGGKRNRGRPKLRWRDSGKRDVGEDDRKSR